MSKPDRIGLISLFASLLAIAAVGYTFFQYQHEQQLTNIRTQGVSLVRALSGVPFDQLAPGGEQHGVIRVLQHRLNDNEFAYVSVVDAKGRRITDIVADGQIVPPAQMPSDPTAWIGQAQYNATDATPAFIEFHAPLLQSGRLEGFVRLGYQQPDFGIGSMDLPLFASVALPVFLLAPLFYLLLRMETRPLRAANAEIANLLDGESIRRLDIHASGEFGDFLQRFNRFVQLADERIESLKQDQKRLITSTKLLTYRKNRIETVLESLPEAVLILDESGNPTFANEKLSALFGASQQEILDHPVHQWCDNPDIIDLVGKYQTNGRSRAQTDTIRFELNASAEQSIVTNSYPLFSPTNPSLAIGTLIVFRDETQEALARQARAEFVGHLSHELKSPLNVLAMYSESLMSDAGRSEEFRIEAANVIADEVDRLGRLITGLLNMTQIENGSLTPDKSLVKLREVAEAAFEEAKNSTKDESHIFEFDAPQEINPVLVDKDLIRIAITNLLSNAIKYNNEGGVVRLEIAETEDAMQIRVSDTGIGISEEDGAKIFDKFYRSDDERVQAVDGHGIGLALTKQIVELHHGTLSVNYEREQGAEFIINLWKEATAVRQAI